MWLVFFSIIIDSIATNSIIITMIITFITVSMIVAVIDLVGGPKGCSDHMGIATTYARTCMAMSIQDTSALTGRWHLCLSSHHADKASQTGQLDELCIEFAHDVVTIKLLCRRNLYQV